MVTRERGWIGSERRVKTLLAGAEPSKEPSPATPAKLGCQPGAGWSIVSAMSLRNSLVSIALALSLSALGCGGASGRASVTPGVMPAGETFTGVWHSPQYGEMQLVQTGNSVIGEYTHDERRGRIQGTATGDLLRFEWTERRELVAGRPTTTRGRGYFRFEVGDDTDRYIVGEWGHDDNETGGGPWRAVRDRRRRASLSGGSATSGGASPGSEGEASSGDAFPEGGSGGDAFPGGGGSRSRDDEEMEGLDGL